MNDKKIIGSIILEGASTSEDTVITGSGSRRVIAEGTLQDLEVENRNHRIYRKIDMEREIKSPRTKELLAAKQFFGHMAHPLSNDLIVQQTIDPKISCVSYLDMWIDGNLVKGRFKGTNNKYGDQFDADLRDGCKPAFSLRALGSIQTENGKAYVTNVKLITYDYVIYPSHKVAYTTGIISESAISDITRCKSQLVVPENDPGTIINLTGADAKYVLNKLQRESANMSNILDAFGEFYDSISNIPGNSTDIMLSNAYGDKMKVNLESHVENAIMDYVFKM